MLPGITVSEDLNFVKNVKNEGRTILVIGNTGYEKDTKKVYTFTSKEDAIQQLKKESTIQATPQLSKPYTQNASSTTQVSQSAKSATVNRDEAASNAFIRVIGDIFGEADANHTIHGIGLNQVYAVNVGKDLKKEDILAALVTAEQEIGMDIDMEVYPGLTDIEVINAVKGHLDEIKQYGDYRIAIATVKGNNANEVITSVQSEGKSAIDSSRIVLHVDPGMVGFLAAKIACTPYYQDPAKNPYYTVDPKEIKKFPRTDLDKILDAGLVADQIITRGGARMVEVPYIRSTRYINDKSAVDSYLHQRLNADQHAIVTDLIAGKYIKSNNTETAKHSIELECRGYLGQEVAQERLINYGFTVNPKKDYPNSLIIDMTIQPPKSIHFIEIKRVIEF